MKKSIQQIIALILILSAVITGSSFITPPKVEAQISVLDAITHVWTAITSTATTASAAIQTSLQIEQITVKHIAIAIAKQILQQLTLSIVNWINSGFNGSPSFVANPGKYFQNLGDEIAGNFLQADGDLRFLCSPFSLDVRIALALKMTQSNPQKYTCTLSSAIKNATNAAQNASITGFVQGDFSQGGWPAFMSLTTQPQNNAGGAYLQAEDDLAKAISTKVNQKVNELQQGAGFLSKEVCTYTSTDSTGVPTTISESAYNQINYTSASGGAGLTLDNGAPAAGSNFDINTPATVSYPGSGGNSSLQLNTNIPGQSVTSNSGANYQKNCTTQTPGSVAAGVLQKSLGIPADELLLANDIDAIISAAFSQLSYQVLNLGLSAISGGGSGSAAGAAYLQQLSSQSGAQLKQAKDSANQTLAPYLTNAQQVKSNFDSEISFITSTKTSITSAITCWSQYPNNATAQSQVVSLQQILTTQIAPILAKVSTEDSTVTATIQSLVSIQNEISSAQNTNDLNAPGQQLQTLTALNSLATPADIANSQNEVTTTNDTLAPINNTAQTSLQQCHYFASTSGQGGN